MNKLKANRGFLERLIAFFVWTITFGVLALFGWMIADLFLRGMGGLSWQFLSSSPFKGGTEGGIFPIIVSTLVILAIAIGVAAPIGLGTAAWLAEITRRESRSGRLIRRSLDALAGAPSIVFGLFGNLIFVQLFGFGYSLLSGGLTLACMALPIIIRATEESFRSVPQSQREASAALGFGEWTTLWRVILPQAAPGVVVGLILGIGRALAETAALLFTAGMVDRMPRHPLDSGRALSVHIYTLSVDSLGGDQNASASALVLLGVLIATSASATWLTNRFVGNLGKEN